MTGLRPLEVAALALRRDAWDTLPRSLLLTEAASLLEDPTLAADLLDAELLLWELRDSEAEALAEPLADLREVVEVPEAELPDAAAEALLRLPDAEEALLRLPEADEALLLVVAERRLLLFC